MNISHINKLTYQLLIIDLTSSINDNQGKEGQRERDSRQKYWQFNLDG